MPRKSPPSPSKQMIAKKATKPAIQKTAVMKKKTVKAPVVSVQQKESRGFLVGLQFAIAASAIAVLVLVAALEQNVFATRTSDAAPVPVTIGLEFDSPLSLGVLFARKQNAGYVSITNTSTENIHVSLPSNWTRTEVTGTDLKNVTQDIPVFGFSRYALPAGAGIKLLLPEAPGAVFFDSTSTAVAAIDLKTIDLTTSQTDGRIVLVQKQSLIPLWSAPQE